MNRNGLSWREMASGIFTLAVIVLCFYLLLCGIALHQEGQEAQNKIRWEKVR
jgi:hypothetical protein